MESTLTTRGIGLAAGSPDALRVRVAVVGVAKSVSEALSRTASGVEAAGDVARTFTDPQHITSTGLQVWPRHDNDGRQTGYEARHALTIFCPGLDAGGRLIGALGDLSDRVLVEGFEPVISDPLPLQAEARRSAWADARRKAEEFAELAGGRVGEVVSVSDGEGGAPAPVERFALDARAAAMPIEAGSQNVSASVTVTWRLMPGR